MALFRQHPRHPASRGVRAALRRSEAGFTAIEVLIGALVNGVSMTKMRAASDFSKARFYVDIAARSFRVEVWQKTAPPQWVQEGGTTWLSQNDNFSFGNAGAPPPDAVNPIAQATACLD